MIPTLAYVLRGSAAAIEALGARRQFRTAPVEIEGAFDFVSSFRYGEIRIKPAQVREEMIRFLARLAEQPPRSIVELGTAAGGTLFLFTRVAAPTATIVSVDLPGAPFGGGYPRTHGPLLRSFARSGQTIHLVRGDTHAEATLAHVRSLVDHNVDLVFVDADHSYQGVRADVEMYTPLVRSGGLIALHDIVEGVPDKVGEVPRFWKEIRDGSHYEEFVADWSQGGYGIGVMRKP